MDEGMGKVGVWGRKFGFRAGSWEEGFDDRWMGRAMGVVT